MIGVGVRGIMRIDVGDNGIEQIRLDVLVGAVIVHSYDDHGLDLPLADEIIGQAAGIRTPAGEDRALPSADAG